MSEVPVTMEGTDAVFEVPLASHAVRRVHPRNQRSGHRRERARGVPHLGLTCARPPSRSRVQPPSRQVSSASASSPSIRVDVVAEDRAGRPVDTLTAADFEVVENGTRRDVSSVTFIRASGALEPGARPADRVPCRRAIRGREGRDAALRDLSRRVSRHARRRRGAGPDAPRPILSTGHSARATWSSSSSRSTRSSRCG